MDIPHELTATSLHPFLESILGPKFQRAGRGFSPATVFTSILKMGVLGTRGYRQTLIELKEDLGEALGWHEKSPSASALCQSRLQFSYEHCKKTFHAVEEACPRTLKRAAHQYGGFNLYAIDMTRSNLPVSDELVEYFGIPTNKTKKQRVPQASFTMIMDVGRNRPTSWVLEGHKGSEVKNAKELCAFLGPEDLLIGDRGYPSFQFFSQLTDQNTQYLIRLRTNKRGTLREVYDFLQSDKEEDVLTVVRGKGEKAQSVKFRVFKQRRKNGTIAAYATNLFDHQEHTREQLCSLYCSRWRIETAFKEIKIFHAFEDMRAESVLGIYQEVTALMVFMLMAAEMEAMAYERYAEEIAQAQTSKEGSEPCHEAEPPIRFNRVVIATHIVIIMKNGLTKGPEIVAQKVEQAMHDIWRYRQRVKRGRSFQRVSRNPGGKWSGRSTH